MKNGYGEWAVIYRICIYTNNKNKYTVSGIDRGGGQTQLCLVWPTQWCHVLLIKDSGMERGSPRVGSGGAGEEVRNRDKEKNEYRYVQILVCNTVGQGRGLLVAACRGSNSAFAVL